MKRLSRTRRYERGQAIAELTVALLGIMALFAGLIFMLALGQTNLKTMLEARGGADAAAMAFTSGGAGEAISRWDAGGDKMMFTNDDLAVMNLGENGSLFQNELRSSSGNYDLAIDLSPRVSDNFARSLSQSNIFLVAADLVEARVERNPDDDLPIEDLRGAYRALIYAGDLKVSNRACLPAIGMAP